MEWISVAERLPERNELLCVYSHQRVTVGTYSPMMEDWWTLPNHSSMMQPTTDVTHWMPLPPDPLEVK